MFFVKFFHLAPDKEKPADAMPAGFEENPRTRPRAVALEN